jgi:hypothetical protein
LDANHINKSVNQCVDSTVDHSGDDYISKHTADEIIDVQCGGSAIVNLSLGATRAMVLQPKKDQKMEKGVPVAMAKHNI